MNIDRPIIGIMAATKEGVIGLNNALPWNYPDELKHYEKMTSNHHIIIGLSTYEGMPKQLLTNSKSAIVLSDRQLNLNDAKLAYSLEECLNYVRRLPLQEKVFMVGGAETAHSFLEANLLSAFFLTEIHKSYFGDTYLNLNYFKHWSKSLLMTCKEYTIYFLENPNKKF